jgi:hypothetical protein
VANGADIGSVPEADVFVSEIVTEHEVTVASCSNATGAMGVRTRGRYTDG